MLLPRIAWRNLWRHGRRTLITALAMALGLAFSLPMIALIDGVYVDLFDTVVTESLGHAQIHHPDYPKKRAMWETIEDAGALQDRLDALPAVADSTARLFGQTLLGSEDHAVGALLIGVDPVREDRMTGLSAKLVEGRYLSPTPGHEAVLGVKLAERLKVGVGDEVVAVTQSADGSIGNDLYTVVGTYRTGSVLHDRSAAYLHLADVQELLVLPGQVHEIALVAPDPDAIDAMVAEAAPEAEAHGVGLRPWREIKPQLAEMLDVGDVAGGIILAFVFSVAALGILNTMLMSVFERTRELGVIRALGLRPRQLILLVVYETLALTVVALAIGLPLGLGLDAWLVLKGVDLSAWTGSYSVSGVTFDPVVHGVFDPDGVVNAVIGLIFIALFASIWPALRAARLQPVDAMRQE